MTAGTGQNGAVGGGGPVIRVAVDRERCMGSGNCLFWAPGTFELGDDGVAVVIDPAGADAERIAVAVEGCPTRAISISRVDGPPDGYRPAGEEEGNGADRALR